MTERTETTPTAGLAAAVRTVVGRTCAGRFDVRHAGAGDLSPLLELLDVAVWWLNARGITEQWGTDPFSSSERRVEAARRWVAADGAVVAEHDGHMAGVLVLGEAPDHVPAPDQPEVYVALLVASRWPCARGVGAALIELARQVTLVRGVRQLRVDCYGGGDGSLVRFYCDQGFTPTERFRVGTWPGQLLVQHVPSGTSSAR